MDTWVTDSQFWIAFFNIIIIDLILSGDNAVVIGMATRNLPKEQRKKAILIGAGFAVFLRAALTAIASYLLMIPFLMTIGGLLLLWIAVKLLLEKREDHSQVTASTNMRNAVKTIIIADVVMSLDNVLAVAGAAHGSLFLVLFGLGLSIPIIMWGSKIIASALNHFPWLVYLGSAILGYTAGQLIMHDPVVEQSFVYHLGSINLLIPILLAIKVVVIGFLWKKRQTHNGSIS